LQANGHLLEDQLEVNASLRYDQHNQFGGVASPRLSLRYEHNAAWSSRLSLGTGFRAPTSFFEQDHGILDDVQIVRVLNKVEKSHNLSYTLNYTDDRLNASSAYHYTRIENMALLSPNQPNPDGSAGTVTLFSSATTPVIVQGLDMNASYQFSPRVNIAVGAELFHYQFEAGTLTFARPTAKAYLGLDYAGEKWDFSSKLVWTSRQNLRKFHDDGSGQQGRYNLDGSPKLDKSPAFFTLDMRTEYAFNPHLSAYLGVDNLLDYKQIDHESMLWLDAQGHLDSTHVWGPNRGRFIYAGIQVRF
jgi:outer membrane receptor for ferrienterochelin and colicins